MPRRHKLLLLSPLTSNPRTKSNELKKAFQLLQKIAEEGSKVKKHLPELINSSASTEESPRLIKYLAFLESMYVSGALTWPEYVFGVVIKMEGVHDNREFNNAYSKDIDPINKKIDDVRKKHGLKDDEYFSVGDCDEMDKLDAEYSKTLDKHFFYLLSEYNLHEIADLFVNHTDQFDRLREIGRRSVFHKDKPKEALNNLLATLKEETKKAESIKAYTAGITLIGSSLEALLLLRCLKSKQKSIRLVKKIAHKPKDISNPLKWSFDNLINVSEIAGWLKPIETTFGVLDTFALVSLIKKFRNYIHPGRLVRT